jgi:hypothetical protein
VRVTRSYLSRSHRVGVSTSAPVSGNRLLWLHRAYPSATLDKILTKLSGLDLREHSTRQQDFPRENPKKKCSQPTADCVQPPRSATVSSARALRIGSMAVNNKPDAQAKVLLLISQARCASEAQPPSLARQACGRLWLFCPSLALQACRQLWLFCPSLARQASGRLGTVRITSGDWDEPALCAGDG